MAAPIESIEQKIATYIPEEVRRNDEELFTLVTQNVLTVGDADLREQTIGDFQKFRVWRTQVMDGGVWNTHKQDVLENVLSILKSGNHTILSKVYASFLMTDMLYPYGMDQDVAAILAEAMDSDPAPFAKTILRGAIYGRFVRCLSDEFSADYITFFAKQSEFDAMFFGGVHDEQSARWALRIRTVGITLGKIVQEDALGLQFPQAWLKSTYLENPGTYQSDGEGFPESVMYLQKLHLPKPEKLEEAVRLGVPDEQNNGVLEQRIPRILVGIEVGDVGKKQGTKISMLHYISLAPLRRARSNINWVSAATAEAYPSFASDAVLRGGSFDSLPMMIAVRIVREFVRKNRQLDMAQLNRWIDLWVKNLSEDIEPVLGEHRSVLAVAVSETHQANGEHGWKSMGEVVHHIKNQVFGLVIMASEGNNHFMLRSEEEIWELYRQHVLQKELTSEHKLELARLALADPDHKLWRLFPVPDDAETQCVVRWVHYGDPLPEQIARILREEIESIIDLRAETIRDAHMEIAEDKNED